MNDVTFKFLDAYYPIFDDKWTYYLISGGRASGKSTNIAAYFLLNLVGPKYFRGVIARYTQKSIKSSIYRDILDLADQWGITPYLKLSGDEIIYTPNDNMIITHSMRLADGSMTAKGKGISNVSHLLIDEATELPDEEEFIKLNDSLRMKGVDRKVFIIFNPTVKSHWIHKRWYIEGKPNPIWFEDHCFIHTTWHDNAENLDPKKIKEWERTKLNNPAYYNHHILGHWKDFVDGQIFSDWHFDWNPDPEAECIYGLDFGYSNDPCALVRVDRKGGRLWLKEMIYEVGLTNPDISELMESLGIPKNSTIIADSAEPKSIEELKRLGWRNIQLAAKGPDSVRAGINKVKEFEVHVDPHSSNLVYEYQNYAWNKGTAKPIDANNHLMDAIRYSLSLEKKTVQRYAISGIRR